jgi:hypothetical protein
VDFGNVSAAVLANHGIALGEPQASPTMSETTAAAVASQALRGAAVLESRYVHCRMASKDPPIEQDCWAFSLDPSRQRFPFGATLPTYSLVLVDPIRGEILLHEIGAAPKDPSVLPPDPPLGRA